MSENKGPDGWEAEDYDHEKVRELRDQGYDPGSAQQKLRDMGHPSGRSMGVHTSEGEQQAPASGSGPGDAQSPGGEEKEMAARGDPAGGASRDREDAEREGE